MLLAGLDYETSCEWDIDQWFQEGDQSAEFTGFRSLLTPSLWIPSKTGQPCALLAAINESRKGQADLSKVLGERRQRKPKHCPLRETPCVMKRCEWWLDGYDVCALLALAIDVDRMRSERKG